MPMLSVIVPTFNEVENVRPLLDRVTKALATVDFELIVVDDSTDGTDRILADLARDEPRLRMIHRADRRGLASAVTDGIQLATGDVVCVLDADLQHPAEALPTLTDALDRTDADLAIGSRYVPGGSYDFTLARRIVSRVATVLAWFLVRRARSIADPLSGFFAFRRTVLDGIRLQPIGFKILLEILVRGRISRVVEVPYRFGARGAGMSKLTGAQNLEYVKHLLMLSRVGASSVRRVLYSGAANSTPRR
jgi:dolichol-phosphate mannosyltransferase